MISISSLCSQRLSSGCALTSPTCPSNQDRRAMSARKARLDRRVSVDRKAHRANAARKVSADLKGLAVSQVLVVPLAREASVAPLGRRVRKVQRVTQGSHHSTVGSTRGSSLKSRMVSGARPSIWRVSGKSFSLAVGAAVALTYTRCRLQPTTRLTSLSSSRTAAGHAQPTRKCNSGLQPVAPQHPSPLVAWPSPLMANL